MLAKGLALSLEIKQPAVPVGTGISDLQRPILHNCCNPTGRQPTKLGHGRELEELAPKAGALLCGHSWWGKRMGQLLFPGGFLCMNDTKCQSVGLPEISGSEESFQLLS